MAKTILFEENSSALKTRLGALQDSLSGLNTALRTAETGARRATAVTQGLRSAFVHAAAPLTDTLNQMCIRDRSSHPMSMSGTPAPARCCPGIPM